MVKSRNPRLWLVEAYGWLDVARGLGLWALMVATPLVLFAVFVAVLIVAGR